MLVFQRLYPFGFFMDYSRVKQSRTLLIRVFNQKIFNVYKIFHLKHK